MANKGCALSSAGSFSNGKGFTAPLSPQKKAEEALTVKTPKKCQQILMLEKSSFDGLSSLYRQPG